MFSSMVELNFETVEGIVVQVMSCLCAAIGLSFMKLSSLRDGDSLPIQRPLWWLGFLFLSVVATALDVVVLGILPLSMVAPFAGLTIVFSIIIAMVLRSYPSYIAPHLVERFTSYSLIDPAMVFRLDRLSPRSWHVRLSNALSVLPVLVWPVRARSLN